MFTKEKFLDLMRKVMARYDTIEELYQEFDNLFGGSEGLITEAMDLDLTIHALEIAMEDEENQFIRTFIYECDCGRDGGYITIGNSKAPLATPEDLWALLVSVNQTLEDK